MIAFYRLVRPAGPGWNDIRGETGLPPSPDSLPHAFLGWCLACVLVYSALFGAGSFLFGNVPAGVLCAVLFVASLIGLARVLMVMWRDPETGAVGTAHDG